MDFSLFYKIAFIQNTLTFFKKGLNSTTIHIFPLYYYEQQFFSLSIHQSEEMYFINSECFGTFK